MSNRIKKATAILEEKRTTQPKLLAKAEKELKECEEKLSGLKSALEVADNAEDYKKLLQEVRDYEAVKAFCEKKLNEINNSSLTNEEFKFIISEVNKAFASLKKEKLEVINAEIEKLSKLIAEYDSEVDEYNALLKEAYKLHKSSNAIFCNPQSIASGETETGKYIETYYRVKTARMVIEKINGKPA